MKVIFEKQDKTFVGAGFVDVPSQVDEMASAMYRDMSERPRVGYAIVSSEIYVSPEGEGVLVCTVVEERTQDEHEG